MVADIEKKATLLNPSILNVSEFIEVGKEQRALDALYDVIKSKKHRTWQKIHEPIMELYLELCVELKKSHIAKEGLYQYKNICQQVRKIERVDWDGFRTKGLFPQSESVRRLTLTLNWVRYPF